VQQAADWFVTPPRHTAPGREARALDGGVRLNIPVGGGHVAAWRFGDVWHPLVVLSHGWGGRGAQLAAWIAPLMRAGFQVIVFDHVAHGASSGRQAPITAFADGLCAVVTSAEQRGVQVAGFVGHSLGCPAIAMALKGPLKHLQSGQHPPAVVLLAPPASLIRYSRFFARNVGLSERLRVAMQWRIEQRIGFSWSGLELPHAVHGIAVRALVIHDEHDCDVRIESGLAVARAWEGACFKRTFGLGHRRILRDASVVAAGVDFLTGAVQFPLAPAENEWSRAFSSMSGNAPLY
jgi:pimeloyl-ACP methyl ester carboxylesterase